MLLRLLAAIFLIFSFSTVHATSSVSRWPRAATTVNLPRYYDFAKPFDEKGGARVMLVDTLRLLNKSIWRPDSEPLPISANEAIDLAVSSLSVTAPDLRKSHLLSFSLKYFFGDAAEDVWYYEIYFDAGRRFPIPEQASRPADLQRAIVLMDGSVWTPKFQTWDEMKQRFRKSCTYTKIDHEWRLGQCQEKSSD